MFCRNCGNKINEQEKFCRHCGEKNLYITNDLKTEDVQVSKQKVDDDTSDTLSETSDLENISIRINNKYYDNEFVKIEQGYDTKFNWAAFLFGPILILYRKMYKFFKKMYVPLYIAMVSVCIFMIINISFIFKGNEHAFTFMFLLLGVSGVLGILNIIFCIRCGKQYNIEYYYHLKDVMNSKEKSHLARPSFLAPVIFFVINLIICIVLILSGIRMINNILFENVNQVYDNYEEDNNIKEETDSQYQEKTLTYKPMVEYLGMTKGEIENKLQVNLINGSLGIYDGGAGLFDETGNCPYIFLTDEYEFGSNDSVSTFDSSKIIGINASEGMVNNELPVNSSILALKNMFGNDRLSIEIREDTGGWLACVLYDNYTVFFNWDPTSNGDLPTTTAKYVFVKQEINVIEENNSTTDNTITLFPADNSLDCISLTGREMVLEDKYAEMTVDLDNNGYNAHFFISRNAPNAMNFYGYPEWLKSKFVAYKYFGNEYILDGAYDDFYNLNDDYVVQLTVYDLNSDGVDEILFTTSNNVDKSVTEIYSVNVASTSEPFIYRGYILGSYELIYSNGKILSKKQESNEFSEYIYNKDNHIECITEPM